MNHSLRGVETLTTEWWKGPALRPRPVLAGTARRRDDGVLARRDRTSPIDLLAARYPTGISGSRIEDVMPAVATAPALAAKAGDSGSVLEALRHSGDLTWQGSAQHV